MNSKNATVRRGLCGVFAGGLLTGIVTVGSAAILAPTAGAAPDPCSASATATTNSTVSASMSSYLEQHPQVDQALTAIAKQAPTQAQVSYETYFAENPGVAQDLRGVNRPVTELSARCNTQVPPTVLTDALKGV